MKLIKKIFKTTISLAAFIFILQKALLLLSIGFVINPLEEVAIVSFLGNLLNIPITYHLIILIVLYVLAFIVVIKWSPKPIRDKIKKFFKKVKGWFK